MQANSIGIIGGADGPTSVFVAGTLWPLITAVVLGAAVLIALGVWLFLRHK